MSINCRKVQGLHSQNKPMFKCGDCNEEFESRSGLSTHRTWKHNDEAKRIVLECKECGEEFEIYESQLEDDHQNCTRNFCSQSCYTEWQKESRMGAENPFWKGGKGEYICEMCGSSFEDYPSQRDHLDRHFCDWECLQRWRDENTDDRPYYGPNWQETAKRIRERDEVCQVCGEDGTESILDVHHIDPLQSFNSYEKANDAENLILLCRQHHKQIELGRMVCPSPEKERYVINASETNWEEY